MFRILFVIFWSSSCLLQAQSTDQGLFQSRAFTADNLFSVNIEGPSFDKSGTLYVVNFQKDGTVARVDEYGNVELFVTLPEGSTGNSIKFNSKGTMLIADYKGHNILQVNMKSKEISVLAHNDKFNQPNDICINKKNQLFASDPNWTEKSGQIWRIDPDGSVKLLVSGMGTTNGIELSPDEKTLYVNESAQRKIWAFDVDKSGELSNKRLFAEFSDFGFDGMKCDNAGDLYVCRYGKGVIAILSPDGKLVREVPLTGKRCSNLVFGGKDGRSVFVTLQDRKGIDTFRTDTPGRNYPKGKKSKG